MPNPRPRLPLRRSALHAGILALALAPCLAAPAQAPPLPVPVTNNAVAGGRAGGAWQLFSMLGVDSTKRWSGITRTAAAWRPGATNWRALPPVPGPRGRLAATAQVVRGRVYLLGGYTVDSAGNERSLGNVDVFDPARDAWTSGAPIPIPVDDAISGVYRDSLIFLVSGWHDTDNVRDVQLYDAVRDRWTAGTPIPGPGVFGHGGAIAGNQIVFIDGARRSATGPKYVLEPQSWGGTISAVRPESIAWARLPDHPPPARYRPAAGHCGVLVVFAGGTDNPYNYNGIGYDGAPSRALAGVMAFDTRRRRWRALRDAPAATMDHRGLPIRGDTAWIAGGMRAGQSVGAAVDRWTLGACPR